MIYNHKFLNSLLSPERTVFKFGDILLYIIESLYYLATLTFFPTDYSSHAAKRFILSFLALALSLFLLFIAKPDTSKLRQKHPGFLALNFLFLINEIWMIGYIQTLYLPQNEKEILILDIVLESLWRLLVIQSLSCSWLIKTANVVLCSRLLFSLVAPGRFELGFFRLVCGSVLLCIPALFQKNLQNCGENSMKEEDLNTLLKWFKSIPEGVLVFNLKGQIKFMNNYLSNVFEGSNEMSLKEISKCLLHFEFTEASMQINSSSIFTQKALSNFRKTQKDEDFVQDELSSKKLDYKKKAQQITSLEELFNSCVNEPITREVIENYMPVFKAKFYHHNSNEWAVVEIKAHLLSDSNDEKSVIILMRDVTERETHINSLKKEKILYRDNLIASFSHELRTPLNSNLAFLEQCMDSSMISFEAKEKFIKPALTSGNILFFLISDILDYSLMIINELNLQVRSKSIVHTVNHCVELLQVKARQKRLRLNLIVEEHIPDYVCTDHSRVSQILINLLNNALQFTMKGSIDVIITNSGNNQLTITVQDTGIGMDAETQKKLKCKLDKDKLKEKLHENSVGIGLGLFISNKIAKMLDPFSGEGIRFSSQKGLGSKFYFTLGNRLPLLKQTKAHSISRDFISFETDEECSLDALLREYDTRCLKNSFKTFRRGLSVGALSRVLIVDDEVFNIIVIENFCKSLGILTERAFNGQEAINKLKLCNYDGKTPIKLIFMDINMPVMDGYQATSEIIKMVQKKEIYPVEVIGVTAYVSADKVKEAYNNGMVEVINKPLAKAVLMDLLKKHEIS